MYRLLASAEPLAGSAHTSRPSNQRRLLSVLCDFQTLVGRAAAEFEPVAQAERTELVAPLPVLLAAMGALVVGFVVSPTAAARALWAGKCSRSPYSFL